MNRWAALCGTIVVLAVSLLFPMAEGRAEDGFILEYQKFGATPSGIAWQATLGADVRLLEYQKFSFDFVGRIETVSQNNSAFVDVMHAGLTDIDYRLEPRVFWKNYYVAMRHWSLHKADVPGTVPGLNRVAVGIKGVWRQLSYDASIQTLIGVNDSGYNKLLAAEARYPFARIGSAEWYGALTIEALPGVQYKCETGIALPARIGKLLKSTDLFLAYQDGGERYVSSLYGLSASGFTGGFRLHFK